MTETLETVTKKKPEPTAEQVAAEELVRRAREQGLSLTGSDGLLKQLTKVVIETALDQEMTEHLGLAGGALETGQVGGPCQPQPVIERLRRIARHGGQIGKAHHDPTLRPPAVPEKPPKPDELAAACGMAGGPDCRATIVGYQRGGEMTDMLIRDIPDEVIAALDAHAGRLGLSRSEYARRRLAQDAARPGAAVSVQDLAQFAETFADLADPDVMAQAWR